MVNDDAQYACLVKLAKTVEVKIWQNPEQLRALIVGKSGEWSPYGMGFQSPRKSKKIMPNCIGRAGIGINPYLPNHCNCHNL